MTGLGVPETPIRSDSSCRVVGLLSVLRYQQNIRAWSAPALPLNGYRYATRKLVGLWPLQARYVWFWSTMNRRPRLRFKSPRTPFLGRFNGLPTSRFMWIRKTGTLRSMRPKRHRLNLCDRVLQQRRKQRHGCNVPIEGLILQQTLQRAKPFVYRPPGDVAKLTLFETVTLQTAVNDGQDVCTSKSPTPRASSFQKNYADSSYNPLPLPPQICQSVPITDPVRYPNLVRPSQ